MQEAEADPYARRTQGWEGWRLLGLSALARPQGEAVKILLILPAVTVLVLALICLADWFRYEPDEQWCGCDGEGMAHTPGADGFACAAPPAKRER